MNVFLFNKKKTTDIKGKIEKVPREFEVHSPEKNEDWSQQVEHIQVPNGTGPGVRRSKRPLSVCHTRRKCSIKPLINR